MSEIIKNLYLGNYQDAKNMVDVDMVINCTSNLEFYAPEAKKIRIYVEDNGNEEEYKKLYDAIENNILFEEMNGMLSQNKKILCHCMAGQQRSAAIVTCFLIWKYKYDLFEAILFVKSKRSIAFFGNVNFMSTIKHYYMGNS